LTWQRRGIYGAINAPVRIGDEEIRRLSGCHALAGDLSAQVKG